MKINFNNVRKQALNNYRDLVEKLNSALREDYLEEYSEYKSKNIKIEAAEIDKMLENLRMDLIAICCTFDEDNEEFKDLSDEIPENIIEFNPENYDA